jgi:hypothetical protein
VKSQLDVTLMELARVQQERDSLRLELADARASEVALRSALQRVVSFTEECQEFGMVDEDFAKLLGPAKKALAGEIR